MDISWKAKVTYFELEFLKDSTEVAYLNNIYIYIFCYLDWQEHLKALSALLRLVNRLNLKVETLPIVHIHKHFRI